MNPEDKQERERAKLAQQIGEMAELLTLRVELEKQLAKILRIKFLALVGEGFTQEQALDLCKAK